MILFKASFCLAVIFLLGDPCWSFRVDVSGFLIRHRHLSLSNQLHHVPSPLRYSATALGESLRSDGGDYLASVVFLVPSVNGETDSRKRTKFGSSSPVEQPTVLQAVQHLANKATWFADGKIKSMIVDRSTANLEDLRKANVLVALGLDSKEDIDYAETLFATRRTLEPASDRRRLCHFALDCGVSIPALVGPYDETSPSIASSVLPWSEDATGRRLHEQMSNLFSRWTSDDFCYALMIFLNQFVVEIDWVKHSIDATWEKGAIRNVEEFYKMINECGDCVVECVRDDNCRECLGKLTEVDSRDQVQSYKTIVSYESELLRDFSLCILERKNIFNCDAKIPTLPEVTPIESWRGKRLTEEAGRSILIGHLDDEDAPEGSSRLGISWKVACGANVAYDQFPSQNQLFYPASRGSGMWYDPVFRVQTLDGRSVWCKRHYKVRCAKEPGTFRLSVLDNGVTSNEFWTITGVADDLSWIVFHYAGAAKAVGQRYLGGLLCTPDGKMPSADKLPIVWSALGRAGIKPWELYVVDNDDDSPEALAAGDPPLDFYRSGVLSAKQAQA